MKFSKAAKFELTAQKEAVAERKRTAVISEAGPVEVVRTVIDPAEADPVMAVPVPGDPVADNAAVDFLTTGETRKTVISTNAVKKTIGDID